MAATNGARAVRAFRLRLIRCDRKLTQAQLARKVGVSANQISRYERGLDDPGIDALIQILIALEIWLADLHPPVDDPIPPRRPSIGRRLAH